MITIKNFIGGNHIEPLSNKWLEIINPKVMVNLMENFQTQISKM